MKRLWIASALLVVVLAAPSVGAQTWERKCVRGLAGMTMGCLEIPGNMVVESDARGAAEGLPLGFVKGLGMVVVRELVGTYEFLSTPLPVPEGFQPILTPEFPWEYFAETASLPAEPVGATTDAPNGTPSRKRWPSFWPLRGADRESR